MPVLKRHPLVSADLRDAYDWYEDQQAGLGLEFAKDFLFHYELALLERGLTRIAGVDEAGCVIFPIERVTKFRP